MKYIPHLFLLMTFWSCQAPLDRHTVTYSNQVVDEVTPFAEGVITTSENSEFDIMFSPDGLTAYFSRRAPKEKQKLHITQYIDEKWSAPQVCDFSIDRDETASITPNGKLFFFGSERPIPGRRNQGNFDMNIWMIKQTKAGWSTPEPLPIPINEVQIEGEEWPSSNNNFFSPVNDSTFLYTTMNRGSKAIKLYQTTLRKGQFSEPIEIRGLFDDEKYWVYSPVISPDGKFLVFNSYGAPGGAGGEDLYVSKKTTTGWSKAVALGSTINTKNEESSPRFSRDGRYFFFSRAENLGNYEYGEWGIHYIESEYVGFDSLFN